MNDLGMIRDGLSAEAASSGQDVDDSGGNSGFVTQLRELQGGQWANLVKKKLNLGHLLHKVRSYLKLDLHSKTLRRV